MKNGTIMKPKQKKGKPDEQDKLQTENKKNCWRLLNEILITAIKSIKLMPCVNNEHIC